MIRLLQWLWSGCAHKWVEDSRIGIQLKYIGGGKRDGMRVVCHCERCGLPRKFDLI